MPVLPLFAQPGGNITAVIIIAVIAVAVLLAFIFFVLFARYAKLWLRGFVTKAGISPWSLVFMSLRKVNPVTIVDAKIMTVQSGLASISTDQLEAHYLAGGNIRNVVRALIAAQRAQLDLNWETATAIDLAGRNVLEAVQTSVDPKVIDCPDSRRHGRNTLDGVAKDGIQLKARARVTVRTNLRQLIGGATEETVIARVGEGIVSAIGSSASHKSVLANPTLIAQTVLKKGLDSQTAYEIVSIDIADIDVGANVGARLQADQAEADVRIARAKAEERRARAVAEEQVMKARTQENRAKVVAEEAEIPKAMGQAYRDGNLRAHEETNGEAGSNGQASST
ncbi:flotillin-like protein FloA [Stratiformator vulcanicus]|uniref:Flotillin-like protein FloA n=1 Tax=Stratiformator vulcanicus TaxID=2527980 RepID=A0A517QXL5_9PLAN|nr:flotillin-like protein FloA [Stratiformator vulcanicus]QDT36337.1 SigmaW regulon antibacterial [Stratiformator vulcanicus]